MGRSDQIERAQDQLKNGSFKLLCLVDMALMFGEMGGTPRCDGL